MTTLDKAAFHVHGGPKLNISDVKSFREIPRALLLVDVSASMFEPEEAALNRAVAEGIIMAAGPNDPLALTTFAERSDARADFAASKSDLISIVDRVVKGERPKHPPTGIRTAIWDALLQASALFPNSASNNVIFLITDGGDTFSHTDSKEVEAHLSSMGTRVFAVVFDDRPALNGDARLVNSMFDFADSTGGRAFRMGVDTSFFNSLTHTWNLDTEGLARARKLGSYIYALSSVFYRVDLQLETPLQKKTRIHLDVIEPDGTRLVAYYPHELLPCSRGAAAK